MQNLVPLLSTFRGRIGRGQYWTAILIYIAITVALFAIGFIMFGNSILALSGEDSDGVVAGLVSKGIGFFLILMLVYIPMVISGIFVGIKRLHDRDKSGWWLLLFYLGPVVLNWIGSATDMELIFSLASFAISIWMLVELGFLRGTIGSNQYGPDPVAI
jgi:uncharacterized membrane protein YhaH (DUF805 family)